MSNIGLEGPSKEDSIKMFREVTGADEERARFYLEATGWEFQLAIGSFFESVDEAEEMGKIEDSDPEVDATRGGTAAAAAAAAAVAVPPVASNNSRIQAVKKPAAPRGGLMTLDSLRNERHSEDDSSDDDSNKQAFYAGGSQSSGQQVLGPPKSRDELVAEMFKKAREHGAEEVSGPAPQQLVRKKPVANFSGMGYKLGETPSGGETVGEASSSTPEGSGTRELVLRLWSQGFTVGDGELRSYQDPSNVAFLNSVKRGEVPRELIKEFQGQEVALSMEDRRGEDYAPPKPQVKPFAGKGQMLGSPAPTVSSATTVAPGDKEANETAARESIRLTDGEPTTNIQIRLADGTRIVARFNPSHTVNDLHSFINLARPQFSSVNYLLTLFPSTDLVEKAKTLKDANVLNSTLVQKIKQ